MKYVVRVVRGICCCKRIDCSVVVVVRVVRGIMRGRGTGVMGLRYIVVRVVRGICCCKRIYCSVFVVVRFVRGFYEEGGTGVIGLRYTGNDIFPFHFLYHCPFWPDIP